MGANLGDRRLGEVLELSEVHTYMAYLEKEKMRPSKSVLVCRSRLLQ
jgi:hypothetical protein